jgi:alcohol dehydrogenase, propanol-preferring
MHIKSNNIPKTMHAVICQKPGVLEYIECATPIPHAQQLLLKVLACGVCRTDLHILDGELPDAHYPIIPGHQVVGIVVQVGENVDPALLGKRMGVGWLGQTCNHCQYCQQQQENLCDTAKFTGCHLDGGYAEYCVVNAAYAISLPDNYTPVEMAPLLCAGLIGLRAYKKTNAKHALGLYGFGASAHLVIQLALNDGLDVYAFTRPGDIKTQLFAKELGACWAGGSNELPPIALDAAIIFAADGTLIPHALRAIRKGGKVVCAGIHMSNIPKFPYALLWGEREIVSVANLTRKDAEDFMRRASNQPLQTTTHVYPLKDAPQALADLRQGRYDGAYVLKLP